MGVRSAMSRLAMEDGAELGEPVALVPETEMQGATDQAELTETAGEIDSSAEAIEEASDDIDGLEVVQDVVEASVEPEVAGGAEGPGMEPVAAGLAAEAVARIRAKYRLGGVQSTMPAIESFGRSSSRKQATRLALLGIGDTIKKIWERIKAFFKGLWEKIKLAVKSVFQSNMRTAQRAKSLLEELSKNSNKYAGSAKEEIKSSAICKAFNDNGKTSFDIALAIIGRHAKTTNVTEALMKEAGTLAADCKTVVGELKSVADNSNSSGQNGVATGGQDLAKSIEVFIGNIRTKITTMGSLPSSVESKVKKEITSGDSDIKDSDVTVYGYGPLLNSRYFTLSIIDKTEKDKTFKGETTSSNFTYKKIAIGTSELDVNATSSTKALDTTQMNKMCNQVLEGTKTLANAERDAKLGNSISSEVMAVIDSVVHLADKLVTGENDGSRGAADARATINIVKQVNDVVMKSLSQAGAAMNIMSLSSYNHGLDYVSGSMKLYK